LPTPLADITQVEAPSSASNTALVQVTVSVKNVGDVAVPMWCQISDRDTGEIPGARQQSTQTPVGSTVNFTFYLYMPNRDWNLRAEAAAGLANPTQDTLDFSIALEEPVEYAQSGSWRLVLEEYAQSGSWRLVKTQSGSWRLVPEVYAQSGSWRLFPESAQSGSWWLRPEHYAQSGSWWLRPEHYAQSGSWMLRPEHYAQSGSWKLTTKAGIPWWIWLLVIAGGGVFLLGAYAYVSGKPMRDITELMKLQLMREVKGKGKKK